MEPDELRQIEDHMDKSLEALRRELTTIRTGRANPSILEHLQVDYYGVATPLQQLATISTPDPRQLLVQPYDRTATGNIEKAIRNSDLGLNPTNEGTLIRITIPTLTEERRRDLVKVVHKRVEETRVAIRNVRREANDEIKRQLRDGEMSKDDEKLAHDQLQDLTDKAIREADAIGRAKEEEVREV